MLVKICGITSLESATTAADAGADFIGFVFANSKRKISPEKAASIAHSLPASVQKIGVFVNETAAYMNETAKTVGLDMIQLHGEEPAETAEQLTYPIIKAFPANIDTLQEINQYPCDYFLLDTPRASSRGGSGVPFDWSILENLRLDQSKFILAGGLTPENIGIAIHTVKPAAVDVSSGVETNGKKDPLKIRQFITRAKQTRKDELQ
ncbi:phosphoribosylanthranilate isomerase [Oceanobacillus massiliensis]|uniref:phosphoribosylanthranilate isomerase n=1 Tax=Oceanobacillus massiliensis TaxID=1465765 RepID=UPI000289B3EF|nr:phosphoribosylanthranilate isomerase [Oceanobacillus massiliensis]